MSEQMIYKSITNAMSDIGAVGKNSKNQQQGFMFRGIDAVMNAINPALIKNKIFVVPEIIEQTREERQTARGGNLIYSICKVKYTFYAEDGSNIQATVIGEGMDSGDKATNKAMSIAFKYACFQVFCIPTEEMKDPDAETPPESKKKSTSKPKITPVQAESNASEQDKIDAIKIATINGELQRTGVGAKSMCSYFHVSSIEEFTTEMFIQAMEVLKKKPDISK